VQSASDAVELVVLAQNPARTTLASVTMTTGNGFLLIWADAGYVSTVSNHGHFWLVVDGVDVTAERLANAPFGGFTGMSWPFTVALVARVPVAAGEHVVTFEGSSTNVPPAISVTDGQLVVAEVLT
jgi:hypothetical protein